VTRFAVVLAVALVATGAASAAAPAFKYERPLVTKGKGPFTLVPDVPLTGHARSGFDDLRIVDRQGAPVAWRFLPARQGARGTWPARKTTQQLRGKRTVILVDLGLALPVTSVIVDASTPAFDRPVLVAASLDGKEFWWANRSRIYRYAGARRRTLPVDFSGSVMRYVRITIDNGDDRPLRGVRVRVSRWAVPLLVAGGGARPYTLRYGSPRLHAPDYDFARLPLKATGVAHASPARLGPERKVAAQPKAEPRTPSIRSYHWLVLVGLALAAVVVGAAGFLVVRRKTPS
jgi:hypothetical protein